MPPAVCTLGMFIVDTVGQPKRQGELRAHTSQLNKFAVLDASGAPLPGREIPPQARVRIRCSGAHAHLRRTALQIGGGGTYAAMGARMWYVVPLKGWPGEHA
jgi:hypothetical protein